MKKILFLIIISSVALTAKLKQNYNYTSKYSYGLGLKVSQLLNDHPAKEAVRLQGGGMGLSQNGIEFRSTYYIDENNKFRIPLNVDYIFFRAEEKVTFRNESFNWVNNTDLLTISTGFHYSFTYLYFANAWLYSGLEVTGNYFRNSKYQFSINSFIDPSESEIFDELNPNDNIWRFGTNIRLGVEAELQKSLMIDFSFNYHLLNLIGRDEDTGQLFVSSSLDKGEDLTSFFNFTFMFKYRM